jgi:hypothetical protein
MANVTGTIGNEAVDLENAATEETLRRLLASVNTLNQSILRGRGAPPAGGGGGGGSGGGGSGGIPAATTSAFATLGQVVGTVMRGLGNVAGALTGLGIAALNGNTKLSTFYGSLSGLAGQIPVVGRTLSNLIGVAQKLLEFQEKNLEVYQNLTRVGVNFGGALMDMRVAAAMSYMTLDDFNRVMSANSKTFLKLGGTVNDGAVTFAKLSNSLIKGEAGSRLLALGYTTSQVNEGLAGFVELTGFRTSQEMKNVSVQKALVEGAASYLEQLDGLARLTGKSREQQEEELKAASKNAAWQAKLATMTEAERDKAVKGLAHALAVGGKGAVDAFQSQVMGIAPDKAGAMFTALASETSSIIRESADMVYDNTKTTKDVNEASYKAMKATVVDMSKQGQEAMFALIRSGGLVGESIQQVLETSLRMGKISKDDFDQAMKNTKIKETEAAAMTEYNKAVAELSQNIVKLFGPAISAATTLLANFATSIIKIINRFFPGSQESVGSVNPTATGRATGSLGVTGKLFENFGSGTPTTLHGTEAVVTPSQMTDMMASAMKTGQDNILADRLQQLNNVSAEMLRVLKETSDLTKRNLDATKSLNRNLFA